jgi:hypothetical protein
MRSSHGSWWPIRSKGRGRRAPMVWLAGIGLAALWISVGPAHGSIMLALDLSDLVQQADHIAVVDVKSVRSDWDAKHERIYSTIELAVVDSWKSSGATPATGGQTPGALPTVPPTTLTIVQPGGTVGDISMVVMGMARFTPGVRSLVFLRGQATRAQVVGMSQGIHPLTFEATTQRWTVTPPSLAQLELVPRASAPLAPAVRTPVSGAPLPGTTAARSRLNVRQPVALDDMKAEVLRLMAGGP